MKYSKVFTAEFHFHTSDESGMLIDGPEPVPALVPRPGRVEVDEVERLLTVPYRECLYTQLLTSLHDSLDAQIDVECVTDKAVCFEPCDMVVH